MKESRKERGEKERRKKKGGKEGRKEGKLTGSQTNRSNFQAILIKLKQVIMYLAKTSKISRATTRWQFPSVTKIIHF